jgi:hypothetical protein
MRNSEWINLFFFSAFIIVSILRPIANTKGRIKAIATGLSGIILILASQSLQSYLPLQTASTIRDWLPAPLMLFAYWQAGNLIRTPNEKLQNKLVNFDRKIFAHFSSFHYSSWLESYFEFVYLFCYPLVPGGLGVLYILHFAKQSDIFWTAVLSCTYVCHALVPFTQTLPPWMLEQEKVRSKRTNIIRSLNFLIIKHASIHANTLPSAHVASSLAVSLILLLFSPLAGFIFLLISISIAIATITGRYHYTLDVVTAAILVIIMFGFLQIWI